MLSSEQSASNLLSPELLQQRASKKVEEFLSKLCAQMKKGIEILLREIDQLPAEKSTRLSRLLERLDELFQLEAEPNFSASAEEVTELYQIAKQLINQQKWLDANDLLFSLVLIIPNSPLLWTTSGMVAQELQHWEQALTMYAQASALDHNSIWNSLFSAECLYELGKEDEAKKKLEELITNDSSSNPQLFTLRLENICKKCHIRRAP